MTQPLIGITMGDPAGVGPEICMKMLSDEAVLSKCVPLIFGDAQVMSRVADLCGLKADYEELPLEQWEKVKKVSCPTVIDCGGLKGKQIETGKVQPACGKAAGRYIKAAVKSASKGWTKAVVTAPIHKFAMKMAGFATTGHTEMIATLTEADRYCMMMASLELKVCLVTTHVSIKKVPTLITRQRILEVIELAAEAMKRLGRKEPVVGVCGLNPHGGEEGLFGNEEGVHIRPAIADAIAKGIHVEGPIAPDTAFVPTKRKSIDVYVVMYHDQGLIPFKMLSFEEGVNITLGLPIVRTSVDHGTAFDIAWTGKASSRSLSQAVLWAVALSENQQGQSDLKT